MAALVGVYIPAFNAAKFLENAIESVLSQNFKQLKLIILDDASADETPNIVQKFCTDQRVLYVRNEKNLGMSRNWNKGLSLLDTPYIAKLDADDYYEPEFLEAVVEVLEENPKVGLAFCATYWHSKENKIIRPYTAPWTSNGRVFLKNLTRNFCLHSPSICVRKQCYDKLGGFVESMRIHSDWEMWTRICCHYDVSYVDRPLAHYNKHPDNCTAASESDSRSPDDFTIWLDLLDAGLLPYSLDYSGRSLLEMKMAAIIKSLLYRSLNQNTKQLALACAEFLSKRRCIPVADRLRFQIMALFLKSKAKCPHWLTRGRRLTEPWKRIEKHLCIRIPAKDPYQSLCF